MAEDEDILDAGDEMVIDVAKGNEFPMSMSLRDESDTEDTGVKRTISRRKSMSAVDKQTAGQGMGFWRWCIWSPHARLLRWHSIRL
jgi:hypothetical protein